MSVYLREELARAWAGQDPFEVVEHITGDVYRELEGRRTLRFELHEKAYFLKLHRGIGWKEIFKNLVQGRLPVLGASNEKAAIEALQAVDVGTMSVAAFGEKGQNPARQLSFIVTDAIEPSISLEDLAIEWREQPPSLQQKRAVMATVCHMARAMHEAGVNHRDFYICHFLLRNRTFTNDPDLAIIDLHRALIHKKIPYRWRLKDLASLYFSAFDVPLTLRDKLRFIRDYTGLPLREALNDQQKLWQQVEAKAQHLYKRAVRKGIIR
ncbi:lipopolysaccharide core heptose(I) kinase RfaP [Aestuariicella hydrocarbonica]|uniref:Lipopolysaccharide core heptose(I) kinase n=1 Tax=Pseudomaricurvus hydrocarbonicus TaxID=1470433 RepID=A0A9E5MKH9_9GAMM|nr:lipopolysaccharide core heptose(I) kinase RfaP [Aestuariicella hydrocarbonica]NHO66549.1 lipopolysaccharide core heptose(I) kinase RfaP [Aestuariicella hydrocarbonica]